MFAILCICLDMCIYIYTYVYACVYTCMYLIEDTILYMHNIYIYIYIYTYVHSETSNTLLLAAMATPGHDAVSDSLAADRTTEKL